LKYRKKKKARTGKVRNKAVGGFTTRHHVPVRGSGVGKCLPGESWQKRAEGRNIFVREEQTTRNEFLHKESRDRQ